MRGWVSGGIAYAREGRGTRYPPDLNAVLIAYAREGRGLVLASHSVTLCDPARRVLGLQWG